MSLVAAGYVGRRDVLGSWLVAFWRACIRENPIDHASGGEGLAIRPTTSWLHQEQANGFVISVWAFGFF